MALTLPNANHFQNSFTDRLSNKFFPFLQSDNKISHHTSVVLLQYLVKNFVSDIAMFVLKRDVKLQLTN